MSRPQFETAHYIASSADLPLQDVTSQLEAAFDLPPFNFDGEASWGWVELPRGTYQLR